MGRIVEDGELKQVGGNNLKAPDDHDLGGSDPADSLGHHDAAEHSEDGDEVGHDPVEAVPVEDADCWFGGGEGSDDGDNETPDAEPKHEDGVVDMASLAGNNCDPGREDWDGDASDDPNKVVVVGAFIKVEASDVEGGGFVGGKRRRLRKESWRTGEDDDSGEKDEGDEGSVDAAVISEEEGGEEHGEGGGGEEHGSGVAEGEVGHGEEEREEKKSS